MKTKDEIREEVIHYLWDNCPDEQFNHTAQRPYEMISTELCTKITTDFTHSQLKEQQEEIERLKKENEIMSLGWETEKGLKLLSDIELQSKQKEVEQLREGISDSIILIGQVIRETELNNKHFVTLTKAGNILQQLLK
jgi:hypothetical protein